MTHPETAIRARVVQLLVAANTVAGDRVFPNRKTNLRDNELPAICVYMLQAEAERLTEGPVSYKHEAVTVCELWLQSGTEIDRVDDELDTFELQVWQALAYDRHLGIDELSDWRYTGTDRSYEPPGEREFGDALVSFLAEYRTDTPMPTSAVPFEAAQTTWNLGNEVDPGDEVQDLVLLEGDQTPP